MTDALLSQRPTAVRAATDEDPDAPVLVVGSRRFGAGTPLRSRVGNAISTVLMALLTGRRVPDTQSGLRGISPAALPWMLAQRGDRYEYEMRVLMGMAADRGGRRVRGDQADRSGSLTQGSKPLRRPRKHRRRAKAPDPLALRRRDHGEPSRD
jgi:hypothetical protein